MKRFNYDLKMSDGSLLTYKADVPDNMTVDKMIESISKAYNFFILDYPSGDRMMINVRHIMSIKISDISCPSAVLMS